MVKITNPLDLGPCPLCGQGRIVKTTGDYVCTNRLYHLHGTCKLSIPLHFYGIDITEGMVRKLISSGKTELMVMTDGRTKEFLGRFVIDKDKGLEVEYDRDYINARCPHCGGRIVKTRSRYECENALAVHPTCGFFIPNYMKKRNITDKEVEDYLRGMGDILDGFIDDREKGKEKKNGSDDGDKKENGRNSGTVMRVFSAFLSENANGTVGLSSDVGTCPLCGGTVFIGDTAFNCSNFKEKNCGFHIWKSYGRHRLSLREIREILNNGGRQIEPYVAYDDKGRKMLYTLIMDSKGEFIPTIWKPIDNKDL